MLLLRASKCAASGDAPLVLSSQVPANPAAIDHAASRIFAPSDSQPLCFGNDVAARISQLVAWSTGVIDFEELRARADEIRNFIQMSEDKARALRVVISQHDVVLGIFPCAVDGMGLHVIKGHEVLNWIASHSDETTDYTHTAIAVHNRDQALALQHALAA